jgi:hypothetical protein
MFFLSSNFFKKERNLSKTPQTSFLMLEAKQIIQVPHQNPLPLRFKKMVHSSLNFKLMEMVE